MFKIGWQSLLIGGLSLAFILFVYANSIGQLWQYQNDGWSLFKDKYIRHVIVFSFFQAFLSSVISVSLGLFTAHALYYQSFKGKKLLVKLFSLTMVLPVLVTVFGLLGVYGHAGWVNQLLTLLGWQDAFSLYGLTGILLAHVFFNLPLSAKFFLNIFNAIPNQQRQLAAQLNIVDKNFIRIVEWPHIKQQLFSVFSLVFMLCFTSFTVVLSLGGGPKYTTLEVAIYQAITFDFDLQKAAVLALLQFVFCFVLFQLSQFFSSEIKQHQDNEPHYYLPLSRAINWSHKLLLAVVIIFLCTPLLNTLFNALNISAWKSVLHSSNFWQALGYSLFMAPASGLLSVCLSSMLLVLARRLYWFNHLKLANQLVNMGMIILAIPTLVLALGLYLLLREYSFSTFSLLAIVIYCNALMTMPFVLRILSNVFYHNMDCYEKLCQSLNISGLNRLRYIEWKTLKRPMQNAFSLATALSLGDFTVIALFGNQHFSSLPRLLYQQLGHYRSQEAAVTACILLLFCVFIFLIIERNTND